jgi:hypothetical protein
MPSIMMAHLSASTIVRRETGAHDGGSRRTFVSQSARITDAGGSAECSFKCV